MDEKKIEVIRPAFLTGSRVYGKPQAGSDWDLVVLVDPGDLEFLEGAADKIEDKKINQFNDKSEYGNAGASLRFGNLNIIAVVDPDLYDAWAMGTRELQIKRATMGRPITRAEAIAHLSALRAAVGCRYCVGYNGGGMIWGPVDTLADCLDYAPPEAPDDPPVFIYQIDQREDGDSKKIRKWNYIESRWMTPKQKEPTK